MDHSLKITTEESGAYLTLTFVGDLTDRELGRFKEDLKEAEKTITALREKTKKKVRIVLDMTDFSGNYSLGAFSALVEFAKDNRDVVEKTASFGGTDKIKMTGEIAATFSHRDNIKIFDKKEDALSWLLEIKN